MADCSSDPTAGCDNSQLVTAISNCCDTHSGKLDSIITKLGEIKTVQEECCTQINANLATMNGLLSSINGKL